MIRSRPTRGMFTMEAALGLLLLAVMATSLAVVSVRHSKVSARLAANRAAVRLAEQALTDMQMSRAPAGPITVKPVQPETGTGKMAWVEVTAEQDGQRVSLIGLAPQASIPTEAGR